MRRLLPLAMLVQSFAKLANSVLQRVGAVGKGKGISASRIVDGCVCHAMPAAETNSKRRVKPRRQYSQDKCVLRSNGAKLLVREHARINEDKVALRGVFDSHDVSPERSKCGAKFLPVCFKEPAFPT